MVIALVSQNASPGLLIFRIDFIRYLVLSGHSVYCFAVDYTSESRTLIESLGAIPVDYTLDKTGLNPFKDCVDVFYLVRKLEAMSPDVVFSFFIKPSIYGSLAAWFAKVPRRIAMLEGLGYMYTPSKSGFKLKKIMLQSAHGLLCTLGFLVVDKVLLLNVDDMEDLLCKSFINKKKLKVFGPIGLDLEKYPYKPIDISKTVRFIFIARLLEEKGIFEYLSAVRLVKKQYAEVEFVILGGLDPDNPSALSASELKEVIDEGLVIYPGFVKNVYEWIADSHVFVLPSYREGYPRSTQEAMSIGRAIITTDVPGCRETVVENMNGFLVPSWDSESLFDKMIYLIENKEEIKRMGEESHRIALDNYDVHKINKFLADIVTGEKK